MLLLLTYKCLSYRKVAATENCRLSVADLEAKLSSTQNLLDEQTRANGCLSMEVGALTGQLQLLQSCMDKEVDVQTEATVGDKVGDSATRDTEAEGQLRAEVERHRAEMESARSTIDGLCGDKQALKTELDKSLAMIKSLKQQLDDAAVVADRSATVAENTVSFESLSTENQTLKRQLEESIKEVETLRQQAEEASYIEIQVLKTLLEESAKEVQSLKQQTASESVSIENQMLKTQLEELAKEVKTLRQQIEEASYIENQMLKAQLEASAKEVQSLKQLTASDSVSIENQMLKTQLEELAKEVETLRQQIEEASYIENQMLKTQLEASAKEVETLRQQIEEASYIENQMLKTQLETSAKEVQSLKQQVEEATARMRGSTTMSAGSVPADDDGSQSFVTAAGSFLLLGIVMLLFSYL